MSEAKTYSLAAQRILLRENLGLSSIARKCAITIDIPIDTRFSLREKSVPLCRTIKSAPSLSRDYSFKSKGKFQESDQVFFLIIEWNTKSTTKKSQSRGRSVEYFVFTTAIGRCWLRINTYHITIIIAIIMMQHNYGYYEGNIC